MLDLDEFNCCLSFKEQMIVIILQHRNILKLSPQLTVQTLEPVFNLKLPEKEKLIPLGHTSD